MNAAPHEISQTNTFEQEIKEGQRFEFGKNWKSFLATLNDDRLRIAEESLKQMLDVDNLKGKKFIDVGSGSGLFSLSARRLGATVSSFDYDPSSVACTHELRSRYFPNDPQWTVKQGSVLDKDFLKTLGTFDIVYSWGVLHHTGSMWEALENVTTLVNEKGSLFIALYNDQARTSKFWRHVKKTYCSSFVGKAAVCSVFVPYFFSRALLRSILTRENRFAQYKKDRGMSITHDWFDWLGGFPFEVAKPEEIFRFYKAKGFELKNITTTNSLGVNEFVFVKEGKQK
jgi:2-polyprenyl-6-hydroxyphenyl methylase/3-demethylubiquinone-9 3-methyltransferase